MRRILLRGLAAFSIAVTLALAPASVASASTDDYSGDDPGAALEFF